MRRLVLLALCLLPLLLVGLISGLQPAGAAGGPPPTPNSPLPTASFVAHDQVTFPNPPQGSTADPAMAANSQVILTVVNSQIRLSQLNGNLIASTTLQTFFGLAADITISGAKATYVDNRFVVVASQYDGGATKVSRLLIAVSTTSTPTSLADALWRKNVAIESGLPVGAAFTQFSEIAGVGYDSTHLYVTFDAYTYPALPNNPSVFTTNRVAVFARSNLASTAAIAAPNFLNDVSLPGAAGGPANTRAYHLQPMQGEGGPLLASAGNPFAGTNQAGISFFRIDPAPNPPVVLNTYFVPTNPWATPFASMVTARDHLEKCVVSNGKLYTAQTVGSGGFGDTQIRLYRFGNLGATPGLEQQPTLGGPEDFYYPTVVPDPRGNVTLVFQGSSFASTHSIYHARWVDASGLFENPRIALASTFSYFGAWGRYTDAVLDPTNSDFIFSHGLLALSSGSWRSIVHRVPNRHMQVLSPNGGEAYFLAGPGKPVSDTVDIYWPPGSANSNQSIRIWLARNGTNFNELIAANTADDGLFSWVATGPITLNARIRVDIVNAFGNPVGYSDTSDASFVITTGVKTSASTTTPPIPIPDNWQSEGDWIESPLFLPLDVTVHSIKVDVNISHPYPPDLEVYLVHPDGTSVVLHDQTGTKQVGPVDPNIVKTYPVPTAPDEGTQSFLNKLLLKRSRLWNAQGQELPWKLRVRDLNPTGVGQLNGWSLEVGGPDTIRLQVTSPNGGERLQSGTPGQITWANDPNNPVQGNVNVILDRDGNFATGGDQTVLGTVPVDTGVFNFTVPNEATPVTTYRARIASTNPLSLAQIDDSDNPFEIRPAFVQVTFPNTNVQLFTGQQYQITWDRLPTNQSVKIELTRNGSSMSPSYELLAASASGNSFSWTPTGPDTNDARIRVTSLSDGSLIDSSDVSFRITTKQITVTGPTGTVDVDTTPNITWSTSGLTGTFTIELSRNGGTDWETLSTNATVNGAGNGTFPWLVTGPASANAQLRITSNSEPTISGVGATFTIRQATITVTAPTSADRLPIGKKFMITWDVTAPLALGVGNVKIEIRRGLNNWELITASAPNTGSFVWGGPSTPAGVTGPPNPVNQSSVIRVTSVTYPSTAGVSQAFKVVTPSVRVLQPNGGEGLGINQTFKIQWEAIPPNSVLNPGNVKIEVSRDNGGTWGTVTASTPNDGEFDWLVTGPATTQALIRISVVGAVFPSETDISDAVFRIDAQQIQVTEPKLNEPVFVGTSKTIQWFAVGVPGTVKIEVHRGAAVETLATNLPVAQGSYIWDPVSGPATGATVHVVSEADASVFGTSDAFDILNFGLAITSPTGSPTWGIGITRKIRWTFSSGYTGPASVYVRYAGDPVETLIGTANAPGGNGSLDWAPDGAPGAATVTVRVPNTTPAQEATATVNIVAPAINVTAPGAGSQVRVGQATNITWSFTGLQQEDLTNGTVNISLSRNGGPFQPISGLQGIPNNGSAVWTPTGPDSDNVRIRVTSVQVSSVFGESGVFKIITPELVVTKPVGGASFIIGDQASIEWTATAITGPLTIEIQRGGGAWETLFTGISASAGSQVWTVTGDAQGNGSASNRIRIRSENPVDGAQGLNPGSFAIVKPSITVGTPNGGQSYLAGAQQTITWGSTGIPASENVKIELLKGGVVVATIAASTPNDGSQSWTVPATLGADYRIRITRSGSPAATDDSDSNFSVVAPTLVVSTPNGGEKIRRGQVISINWTGTVVTALGGGGTVDVFFSPNGGKTYTRIIADTANDGSVNWKATTKATAKARIKVQWNPSPSVSDTSNGNFRIK